MFISALAFTLLNVFVKYLKAFNVYEIVFFRSVGSLFFTIPFLLKNKIPMLGNKKKLLVLRSIAGFISMSLFFAAIKLLPMGSAVSIRYVAPIFAVLFAIYFLKEKILARQWLFLFIAFMGVLILKGFDASMSLIGFSYALLSAAFTGLVFIIIRKIGAQDHPMVVVNYFMIISAVVGGVLAIFNWRMPNGQECLILLSLGIFGYFGQYYMTKALQASETNMVAPLKYIEVIFTMGIGLVWFNESYTVLGIIGILLIVLGLTLNVYSHKIQLKKSK